MDLYGLICTPRVQIKVVENSDIKYPYLNADVIG